MRVVKKLFTMTFKDGYKINYGGKYYTDHPQYKDLITQHGSITSVRYKYKGLKK